MTLERAQVNHGDDLLSKRYRHRPRVLGSTGQRGDSGRARRLVTAHVWHRAERAFAGPCALLASAGDGAAVTVAAFRAGTFGRTVADDPTAVPVAGDRVGLGTLLWSLGTQGPTEPSVPPVPG